MKLFFVIIITPTILFSQERFSSSFIFKLINDSKVVEYKDFMEKWEVADNDDYITKFFDDKSNLPGNLDDKKLYLRHLNSLGYLSFQLISWSPFAEIQFINPNGDKMTLLFDLGVEFKVDSLNFNKSGYYFFNSKYRTEKSAKLFLLEKGGRSNFFSEIDFNEINYWRVKGGDEKIELLSKSKNTSNFPFASLLTKVNDNVVLGVADKNDPNPLLQFVDKIDTTKQWKLVGFKIISNTSGKIFQNQKSEDGIYLVNNDKTVIGTDHIIRSFGLCDKNYRKNYTSTYIQFGNSFDWIPFQYNDFLVIKKCDGYIGGMASGETRYEYYFKEEK